MRSIATLRVSTYRNRRQVRMLKGLSVPLTPQGNSALATLPPWHYSSDCIAVEYWTDPEAIAALLPPGLSLDEKSEGRGFFWFFDWQFTGFNDERDDPARYQYREALALVEAVLAGTAVNYRLYIFVYNDAAIARGPGIFEETGQRPPNMIFWPPVRQRLLSRREVVSARASPRTENGRRPLVFRDPRPFTVHGAGGCQHGGLRRQGDASWARETRDVGGECSPTE
jgi:hypothetical protein